MIVGVLSDTHMPSRARRLPEELEERLRVVDMIIHAGDLTTVALLEHLQSLAPTVAVRGNVDDAGVRFLLPESRMVVAGRFRIGVVHGDGASFTTIERARRAFEDADCIVFGHSHIPTVQIYRSVLMVNPGSPTDPRRQPNPSYAIITVGDSLDARIHYL